MYKDAAGIWHEDRFRPLATALANLTMNLIMVQFIGIYGVMLSTVLSALIVGLPWLLHNLFTTIFETKYIKSYLFSLLKYCLVSFAVCVLTYFICSFVPFESYFEVACKLFLCCIVRNTVFLIIYWRKKEFRESLVLVNKMTRGKIKFLNNFEMKG